MSNRDDFIKAFRAILPDPSAFDADKSAYMKGNLKAVVDALNNNPVLRRLFRAAVQDANEPSEEEAYAGLSQLFGPSQ